MDAHPDDRVKYDEVIQQQLGKGIIEKVSMKETPNVKHYIPHQAVLTPGKATTKVRVVYDATPKCKANALNLNDCLYEGAVILEDLRRLFMRFNFHLGREEFMRGLST